MKKVVFFLLAVLCFMCIPMDAFCQDTIKLALPTKFDFSNPAAAMSSAMLIVSTLIALVMGYLSPYVPFIKKIDKTAWRVAAVIIPALIMVGIFGFKGDAMNVFIMTIWGLFSSNGTHQYAVKPIGKALGLPFFDSPESSTDEEAEIGEAMIKKSKFGL